MVHLILHIVPYTIHCTVINAVNCLRSPQTKDWTNNSVSDAVLSGSPQCRASCQSLGGVSCYLPLPLPADTCIIPTGQTPVTEITQTTPC